MPADTPTPPPVTDAAVEAEAIRILADYTRAMGIQTTWEEAAEQVKEQAREKARAALTAALPQVTDAAVEDVCRRVDKSLASVESRGGVAFGIGRPDLDEAAALIRSLAAERDRLRAERDEAVKTLQAALSAATKQSSGIMEDVEHLEAQRDAAVEALRPFAADDLPGNGLSTMKIRENRRGEREPMTDIEAAVDRARAVLEKIGGTGA